MPNVVPDQLRVILATDCGSTTTKAILIERQPDGTYRQTWRGEAPTTVEEPVADVTEGMTIGMHGYLAEDPDMNAIFIAWGRGVANNVAFTTQPNLRDVGPTALASLGCPLTTDMDGRALVEIFTETIEPQRAGSSYKDAAPSASRPVYNAGEEAELRERLRALGYIE